MAPRKDHLVFCVGMLVLVQTALGDEAQNVVCDSNTIVASVTPVDPSLSLACSQNQERQTAAPDPQLYEYTEDACGTTGEDATAVLTRIKAVGTWGGATLRITSFPRENAKICLRCKSEQTVTCTVVVDIAKEAESCSRAESPAKDQDLTLKEKETVYFKCPTDDELTPTNIGDAYAKDCTTPGTLPEGLVRRDNAVAKAYSLTLDSAPEKATTVCYKCAPKSGQPIVQKSQAPQCYIRVTTQTTTQASTQQTTQPSTQAPSGSPTTSGTVISRASIKFLCSIIALATVRPL